MIESRRCALVLFIFAGVAGISTASDPLAAGVVVQDAESLLEATIAQYAAVDSYRHTCTWSETAEGEPVSTLGIFGSEEQTSTFLFARPDRFVLVTKDREVYSDGRWMWKYDRNAKEFTKERAPDEPLSPWSFFA